MVVHRLEWAAACDPRTIVSNFYVPVDYADQRPRLEIEGHHDLFGDGSIVLFETFGHAPGHQSVRLALDFFDVILTGDACYFADWIDSGNRSPIVGYDKVAEAASLRRIRELRDGGARIIVPVASATA
jgi:N-acyl homoserine lactone hydrolase